MKDAKNYLIDNGLGDLVLNDKPSIKAEDWKYASDVMEAYAKFYYQQRIKEPSLPLEPFLKKVDAYVWGQENHQLKREEGRMLTIKCVAGWCKTFAENLAK